MLATGAEIIIKFSNTNTAENPTLNVNGTDAKPIYYGNGAVPADALTGVALHHFVYDGTYWRLVGPIGSTVDPKANGTAAIGTSTKYAREDHVHPAQTSVAGNAGTATKLATSRHIDGMSFNGSANISHHAVCDTAADIAQKEVTLAGFTVSTGSVITIKFTNNNTAENPTLSVNGGDAYSIVFQGNGGYSTLGASLLKGMLTLLFRPNVWYVVGFIPELNNAATATKLKTARTIRTKLSSTSTASFDGTVNVTPGVTGTLGIGNGGTGADTAADALDNLGAVGRSMTGKSVEPDSGSTVTAGAWSEVFNDYNARSYDSDGNVAGGNIASGSYSHAEGAQTTASTHYSHAEGFRTKAYGQASHAEGYATEANNWGHSEGYATKASGPYSHAEGNNSTASGNSSHAEGNRAHASEDFSHAEGYETIASGARSHAEGNKTVASGGWSHAEGSLSEASASGAHAEGGGTLANNLYSHAGGHYNKAMTTGGTSSNKVGDAFVIGNGTGTSALSNAFRVTFGGAVYGLSEFKTTGADYAEYFEWLDGNPDNEDRVGRFVTMSGKKILYANPGEYILGVVSGQPCIIGNSDEDWMGRWEHDDFGRFIKVEAESPVTEMRTVTVPVLDETGEPTGEVVTQSQEVETGEVICGWDYKANSNYDPSQAYIERKDRPEWDAVGMMGVLAVWDDGTCEVDGYCHVAEGGTATKAEKYVPGATYRVIERVSDRVVKIVFR